MSLGAWLYENDTAAISQAAKYGVSWVLVDPRSSNAAAAITDIRAAGLTAGVYVVASWPDVPRATDAAAKWVSDQLQRLVPRPWPNPAPPAMVEMEQMTPDWQAAFATAYRTWQPARPTSACVAAFQGGLVNAAALAAKNFDLYVECYYGDMSPADSAAVLLEQARNGMPPDRLHPMYDGARLPADHRDGCVFTLERLPA